MGLLSACGGRSFPGSQTDEDELFPVGTFGGSGGVAGSSGVGGFAGLAGTGGTGVSGTGGTGVSGTGGINTGGAAGSGGINTGGAAGSGGLAGIGGTGGGSGAGGSSGKTGVCESCVSAIGPEVCFQPFQQCVEDTSCAALNACAINNNCLSGGSLDEVGVCLKTSCPSFAAAFELYIPYLTCSSCYCQDGCNLPCDPGGQGGGGIGGGGQGGGGQGGGPGVCGSCVQEALDVGFCPEQRSDCLDVNGCESYGLCFWQAGCFGAQNPQACAQQAGCQGSQQARQAFRELATCLTCSACQDTCPINPNQCGGVAGSGGSSGAGGGSLEEQCGLCQENVAPEICQVQVQQCLDNPSCVALFDCFNLCPPDDDFCPQQCFEQNPQGQQGYINLADCYICQACPDTCGALSPDFCGF